MAIEGKVGSLYNGSETQIIFPRTKTKAISDDNGNQLDSVLENLEAEVKTKASEAFVTNKIAEAQLGGDNSEIDLSGYATKDELSALTAEDVGARPNTWIPTAAEIGAAPAGYGLGEAKLISMADIDSITSPGWYYSNESATLGGYTSSRWWMQVLAYGSGVTFATQRIITFGSGLGYELVRHKINGTWSECDWINPPMLAGVEYRTTERYNGLPVYRKLVKYTSTATMGNASGSVDYNIPHGISGFSELVELNAKYGTRTMIPYPTYKTISSTVYGSVSGVTVVSDTNIVVRITNDTFNAADWFFSLAYIKS